MAEVTGKIVISDDIVKVKIGDNKPRKIGNPGLSDGYTPKDGDDVTCQSDNGQIRYVRPVNTEFVHPVRVPVFAIKSKNELLFGDRKAITRDFRNPKNFVPTPRRPKVGPLNDSLPDWHDHAHDGCISGVVEVTATVETELLILDSARASVAANNHKTFDTRVDGDEVIIAGTALKGSIRSAFEMITNSRMSVFTSKKALGSRVQADGVQLVPVRVEQRDGVAVARLLPGTAKIGEKFAQGGQRMQHAAWVSDNVAPVSANGKSCQVTLHKFQHRNRRNINDFQIWKAVEIVIDGQQQNVGIGHNTLTRIGTEAKRVSGWICSSGRLVHNKRDERVFFTTQGDQFLEIDKSIKEQWKLLLKNYREANERILQTNAEVRGAHISNSSLGELVEGTLAYADIDSASGKLQIRGLYPVQLSRRLDQLSPFDLLREELRPAQGIDELSPADRLFGWVGQSKAVPSAFKGRVAIDEARIPKSELRQGIRTLEILASPKPSQARFYLGVERSSDGSPIAFDDGVKSLEIRFDEKKVDSKTKLLRGRAIFVRPTLSDIAPPRETMDDQNRSITSAVKPGIEFTFQIHISDARPVDIGALMWLLEGGNEDRAMSIGFGKPLGYGSVKLRLSNAELQTTQQLKESWLNWDESSTDQNLVTECIQAFKDATVAAYAVDVFESAAHISAYIAATEDPTGKLPIHYPRKSQQRDPEGKNFEWFTANEKIDRGEVKHGLALPDLGGPSDGFPFFA